MTSRRAARVYRSLLRLAPPSLRETHATEMEELFLDRLGSADGVYARLNVWIRATLDVVSARTRSVGHRQRLQLSVPVDERKSIMLGSDIHYALRSLRRQPGGTALVVCMLALGIAANVAVFSLVNGLFLKPFPFAHPDRLVYINETAPRWNLDVVGVNYPDFDRWRKDVKLFEAIALYETDNFNMSDGNGAERVRGAQVTLDFPRVLGVQPVLGRFFTPEEDAPRAPAQQPGAPKLAQVPQVVVIGEALWKERFGGALDVVGKTLRMDGQSRTIVGVMPVEASFPDGVRLWVPMGGDPNQPDQSYSGDGIGRLKPGVTAAAASQDLIRTQQPIWDTRDKDHIVSPFAKPLREQLVSDYTTAASTISAAVGILLLIACANVAAIMLARALARRREMGIRLALGSSRARLMRQLFIENLMLAAVGGAIGLLAGQWAIGAFVRMIPDSLPRWAAFQLDARVMAFSLASVVATVIFFGWAPALHAVGGNLRSAVHASTNGTTAAPRGRRTLSFIVAAEFALAALLLVGGMLLVKAFDRVRHVDPGFRADHVLTFSIPLPVPMSEAASPQPERWMAFWDSLAERTRQLPGVDFAGLVSCAPFGGCHLGNFLIADNALPRPDGKNPVVLIRTATPGYFEAMGLRLREGRFLQEPDGREKRTPVVVVNESFVRTFWGDRANGLGRRVKFNGEDQRWMTIVGVVSDVKHYGLERPMRPGIYVPLVSYPRPTMTMAVHTQVDPESIAPAVREMVRRVDPELPVVGLRTMEESIRRSMALRAAFSWMLAVFAALAFVLAIGGAYGVSTYLVSQRTREIGIRVALGARTVDIFRSILGRGLGVVTTGVACGLTGFVLLGRLLGAVLFGVSPHDATVLAPVALVLIATALMANGLPARRAARLDPMRTLRTE